MNIQNLMQIMQNPQATLERFGIPKDCMSNPQDTAKYLLDNGKVTAEQIQQAQQMYQMFRR
jgi:hypothetical protein